MRGDDNTIKFNLILSRKPIGGSRMICWIFDVLRLVLNAIITKILAFDLSVQRRMVCSRVPSEKLSQHV